MEFFIHLFVLFSIFGILAVSLNLVVGYTGLLSLAHVAFFGIGSYTFAVLVTQYSVSFLLALMVSIIATIGASVLIGIVLSRFKEDYYAIASLGFTTIILAIFLNWQSVTRGPLGIPGIDRPEIFGFEFTSSILFALISGAFLLVILWISRFIVNSSFGRVLKAIREDEEAIQVFGYNTPYYKLVIFVIGAAMAAVAGSLFASYITFISPSSFAVSEMIFILAMIILGGLANVRGAVLGALVLVLLPEILRFIGFPDDVAAQLRQVVYGLLLVIFMLYRPQGLLGEYKL